MVRMYKPNWTEYGISNHRYAQLRSYCLQYPEWLSEAASLAMIGAQDYQQHIRGSTPGDPVGAAVERREALMAKVDLVQGLARSIDDGVWYTALIQNVCMGKPLYCIDQTQMPTANRNAYYAARKRFFIALHERLP